MSWRATTLGEVCDVVGGATPKTSVADYWDGDIPWVTPKDLSDLNGRHEIADTPRRLSSSGLRSCAATVLPAGSVLLSSRAPIGHVAINAVPMATNQGFKSLVPDPTHVDAKFLFWWLRRNRPMLEALGTGATFKEISKKTTAAVPIELPPIEEQRRIAAVLDAADALRAKRRQALATLDTLTQSIFIDMFGDPGANPRDWPVAPLDRVLGSIDSGKSPVCLDRPPTDEEWGVLKLGAVTYCEYDESQSKALPEEVEFDPRHEVRAGDLLFSRKNTMDLVGAAAFVYETRPRLLLSDLTFRLNVADRGTMNPAFLHQVMISPSIRSRVRKLAGGSAASMPNISKARLQTVEVVVPPIEHQNRFEEFARSVRDQRTVMGKCGAELDTLFASLQQRAFRGEL